MHFMSSSASSGKSSLAKYPGYFEVAGGGTGKFPQVGGLCCPSWGFLVVKRAPRGYWDTF
jgi:hypothetical protein